jgi:hypothetical protein
MGGCENYTITGRPYAPTDSGTGQWSEAETTFLAILGLIDAGVDHPGDEPSPAKFGGESEAAAYGRAIHSAFDDYLRAMSADDPLWQPGLRSGPLRPDGLYDGDPVELKPNTPSGIRVGVTQLNRYISGFGTEQGYLYTYDAEGNISLHRVLYAP